MTRSALHLFLSLTALTLAVWLLTGCATPKERVVYQTVNVPIVQPCKPALGPEPDYPTLHKPVAIDIYKQMQTLLAERDLRIARDLEKEAALRGCAGE